MPDSGRRLSEPRCIGLIKEGFTTRKAFRLHLVASLMRKRPSLMRKRPSLMRKEPSLSLNSSIKAKEPVRN